MKILSIFGTRPEAIKVLPVVRKLTSNTNFQQKICVTAQHRQMLDQILDLYGVIPHYDLNIMGKNQDLFTVTERVLIGLKRVLLKEKPNLVLVQGDTTTCFAGALAAFYFKIPIGHIEAGLRTGNLNAPYPEEANRAMTARIVDLHFAPTEVAQKNLRDEGIPESRIHITGNTVIDALLVIRDQVANRTDWGEVFGSAQEVILSRKPYVLITGHRRENFGGGFLRICSAISVLAKKYRDWHFVYPVHLNPNVQQPVYSILGGHRNIHLIKPLDYAPFVFSLDRSRIVLTDSGGVQEEAPSLGKPVLVMRETTERPEALEAGTAILVGTDEKKIINETEKLINDREHYETMAKAHNPYGDGHAAERILNVLEEVLLNKGHLSLAEQNEPFLKIEEKNFL